MKWMLLSFSYRPLIQFRTVAAKSKETLWLLFLFLPENKPNNTVGQDLYTSLHLHSPETIANDEKKEKMHKNIWLADNLHSAKRFCIDRGLVLPQMGLANNPTDQRGKLLSTTLLKVTEHPHYILCFPHFVAKSCLLLFTRISASWLKCKLHYFDLLWNRSNEVCALVSHT